MITEEQLQQVKLAAFIDEFQKISKVLTMAGREKIKEKNFAVPHGDGPGDTGKYPIHDETHARAALSMVAKNGTPEEKSKVHAAVAKKYPGLAERSSVEDVKEKAKEAFALGIAKIASDNGDFEMFKAALAMMTPEQFEMLKESGIFGNMMQGLGQAAGKVRSAVGNMGAGGAAKRMLSAGAAHDAEQALSRQGAKAVSSLNAPAPLKSHALEMSHADLMKHIANTPEQQASRATAGALHQLNNPAPLKAHELEIGAQQLNRLQPAPAAAGGVRYNPLDVSRAAANRAPVPAPAAAPRSVPSAPPKASIMDRLRAGVGGMVPQPA